MLNRAGREAEERCSDDVTAPDSVISGGVQGQPEALLVWLQGFEKMAERHHFWGFICCFSATRICLVSVTIGQWTPVVYVRSTQLWQLSESE